MLQCFFPQYVAKTMRTPLFVINSGYDFWQVSKFFELIKDGFFLFLMIYSHCHLGSFLILQLVMFIQLKNIMAPSAVDPKGNWKSCKFDLKKCSAPQLKTVQGDSSFLKPFLKNFLFILI